MTVVQVPSPYHTDYHEKRTAIVIHTMGGSLRSTDEWFKSNPVQVSAHYGIGLDGRAHQYVSLDHSAHANGIQEPGAKWPLRFGADWANDETISVETEDLNDPNQPVTDSQYASVLSVCRRAVALNPGMVVTSHHIISPQSRANCCGKRWIASGRLAKLASDLGLELFL